MILALLGSIGFALAYEFNIYWLPFIVLTLTLIVMDRAKEKFPKVLILPVFLFVTIHSRWLLSLMQWEGGWHGVLVYLLVSILGFIWMMALVYAFWRVRSFKLAPLYRGLIVIIIEQLMMLGTFGYPLFSLYYTQAFSPFLGLSRFPFLGAGWISFFMVVVSSMGADIFLGKGNRLYKVFIVFFIVWFTVASGGNIWRPIPAPPRQLDVLVLQPNIKESDKLNPRKYGAQLNYYADLIKKIQDTDRDWDVLVMPESIIGDLWEEKISSTFRDLGFAPSQLLIFGQPLKRGDDIYNAVCYFQRGAIRETYFKHKLVPYSETIPPFLNFLANPEVHYFRSGPQPKTINFNGVGYGATVCYESMFPACYQGLKDADILVVLTNDAWFDRHFQALHLRSAMFRAAELHKPLILASNTGISAIISPEGKILQWIPPNKVGFIQSNISIK